MNINLTWKKELNLFFICSPTYIIMKCFSNFFLDNSFCHNDLTSLFLDKEKNNDFFSNTTYLLIVES